MNRPMVEATASLHAELDAIVSPLDVARRIGEFARRFCTLPKPLAARRREVICAASKTTPLVEIAEYLNVSPGRISQITRTIAPALATPPTTEATS